MSLSYAVSGSISVAKTRFYFCFLDFFLSTELTSASDNWYLSEYLGGVAIVQKEEPEEEGDS